MKALFILTMACVPLVIGQDAVTPINQAQANLTSAQASLSSALSAVQQQQTALDTANAQILDLQAQLAILGGAYPVGKVAYMQLAHQNWDPFTASTDPAMQQWIATHLTRIGTYTPYFDAKLAWMPKPMCISIRTGCTRITRITSFGT